MKKILYQALPFLLIPMFACNNSDGTIDNLRTKADSLAKEVMDGHDIAMPKSMKIPGMQEKIQNLIDSIGKLPAKAQESAAPYKAKLDSLLKDLDYANFAMDKWMTEYKYDSAENDLAQRIKYLADEKIKVDKVKEAVLSSVAKADSVLRAIF